MKKLGASDRVRQLIKEFSEQYKKRRSIEGSNLLLFVPSAYKYLKKGAYCFVIVYKLDACYKFLDQIQFKSLKLLNT